MSSPRFASLPAKARTAPWCHVVAVAVAGLALLLQGPVARLLGPTTSLLVSLLAVAFATVWAGWRGGVIATAVTVAGAASLFWKNLVADPDVAAAGPILPYSWAEYGALLTALAAQGLLLTWLGASRTLARRDLESRALQQETLAQLSHSALVEPDLQRFFERVCESLAATCQCDGAAIMELSADGKQLVLRSVLGPHRPPTMVIDAVEGSQAAHTLGYQGVLVMNDAASESRFPVHPLIREKGIRSAMSVVIAGTAPRGDAAFSPGGPPESSDATGSDSRPTPFGVLNVYSRKVRQFGPRDTTFFQSVANLVAAAVERQQVERARSASEERYRTFFEQSTEAIWRFELTEPIDLDNTAEEIINLAYERGYLAECNDAFARHYGYEKAGDLAGARLGDLLIREDPRNREYLLAFVASGLRLADVESVERDRHGAIKEFSNTLLGIVENGKLVRAWGTQRDITAEKVAARELKESEQRFRTLFDASPFAISIMRDHRYLFANRAHGALFAIEDPSEFVGRSVYDFVDAATRGELESSDPASVPEGEIRFYEGTATRADGSTFEFHAQTAVLSLADGPAQLGFLFDITDQRAAELEREEFLERERIVSRRSRLLQEITAELAGALSLDSVADIVLERGMTALEARAGSLALPAELFGGRPGMLTTFRLTGPPLPHIERWYEFPISGSAPAADAMRLAQNVWLPDLEAVKEQYPDLVDWYISAGLKASASLPLLLKDRVLGVLNMTFGQPREFDAEEKTFLLTLAGQCAQAMGRVHLLTEAREAARNREESLAMLNTLLDTAPVGFAFFDREARYALVNGALAQMHGMPAADHLGKPISEIPSMVGERLEGYVRSVLEQGEALDGLEVRGRVPGGPEQEFHLLISFYPVRTPDGVLLGVGEVLLDLTDRVRAEEERTALIAELEKERGRFEAILQQMPSAVLMADAATKQVVLGNTQVEKIWRMPVELPWDLADEVAPQGFGQQGAVLRPEDWPLARALNHGIVTTGEEIVIRRGDGSMGVIRVNSTPIRDRDGKINAAVVVFDDITEKARADAAQRFLAEVGSSMVVSLDENEVWDRLVRLCVPRLVDWCAVVTLDDGGRTNGVTLTQANASRASQAQRLRGLLMQPAAYEWIQQCIDPDQKTVLITPGDARFTEAESVLGTVLEEIGARNVVLVPLSARGREAGVMLWITADSGRVLDSMDMRLGEELARRAALTADNARLYRASREARDEAELAVDQARMARDEAQNANRAKDEFLAVVSHELRTPLTPILGWIELLRQAHVDDEARQHAYDVIERNARAQAQLVNDILDVSRITTGKLRLERNPVQMDQVVERAVESLRTSIANKHISLIMNISDVGLVSADAGRIQQVIWNLLQNSAKFTGENGIIHLSLRREGEFAQLSIEDNGIGIAPNFLPHVFEQFRQADSSATRPAGGLGLGLAIVRHIVDLHGGSVRAESGGEGQGARFTVMLPLLKTPALAPQEENGMPLDESARLDGKNLLLVDDDVDTRTTLTRLLQEAGAQVRAADSGVGGLDLLRSWRPDAVVSDLGMPEMDGYSFRSELRRMHPDLPAIALTAYAAQEDRERAVRAGFEMYLTKPVEGHRLIGALQRVMNDPPQPGQPAEVQAPL